MEQNCIFKKVCTSIGLQDKAFNQNTRYRNILNVINRQKHNKTIYTKLLLDVEIVLLHINQLLISERNHLRGAYNTEYHINRCVLLWSNYCNFSPFVYLGHINIGIPINHADQVSTRHV